MSEDALADLPNEVRDLIASHQQAPAINREMLDAISNAISRKRDAAREARTTSGIESAWKECEEAYAGIDDANRDEYQGARWSKPMSMDGPVTTGRKPITPDHKSTVFVRLTARYVDAGSAKLSEILLPPDEKAFSFKETPVPDLIAAKDDTSQVVHDGLGNIPLMRDAKPGEVPPASMGAMLIPPRAPAAAGGTPAPAAALAPAAAPVTAPSSGAAGGPLQVPLTVKDLAEEKIELASEKAKAAETRIYDWMVECRYRAELRKVIFDGARIGAGVLKAPFPQIKRAMAVLTQDGKVALEFKEKIIPASKWVDPWNFFPDGSCGENIHDGDFCLERDYLSPRQVMGLKDIPEYIGEQIDKVLEEGPAKESGTRSNSGRDEAERKGRFEVWYYYGAIKREELDCLCDASGSPKANGDQKQVHVIVTLINSTVVRATINPLDTGSFPYHTFPWQRRAGHWAGVGVSEQIRTPQKMLNASIRGMLNNAGISAGPQIILDQSLVTPANDSWVITPNKIWYAAGDDATGTGADVNKAMRFFEIPNTTAQLMTIVNLALQLAEESTSIPLVTQGQSGTTTPDTFGAAQLQNNNANQLLRSIGEAFDDYITEPVVLQYYEWLLLDPDVPDDEKGDFQIDAHGSSALVERAIQDQTIAQMAPIAKDPAFGADPKKWFAMYIKTKHMDPADIQYSEEDQEKMAKLPPPKAPVVEAAEIRANVELQKADKDNETKRDIAVGAAHVESHDIDVRYRMGLLDYANRHQMTLDQVKAQLAGKAMEINAQAQLNAQNHAHELRKATIAPPVQAPGRAADGHAFDQVTAQ